MGDVELALQDIEGASLSGGFYWSEAFGGWVDRTIADGVTAGMVVLYDGTDRKALVFDRSTTLAAHPAWSGDSGFVYGKQVNLSAVPRGRLTALGRVLPMGNFGGGQLHAWRISSFGTRFTDLYINRGSDYEYDGSTGRTDGTSSVAAVFVAFVHI
jgi:hypothetical protein